jgi:hypothetical protein
VLNVTRFIKRYCLHFWLYPKDFDCQLYTPPPHLTWCHLVRKNVLGSTFLGHGAGQDSSSLCTSSIGPSVVATGDRSDRGRRSTARKFASAPFWPPQLQPHDLTWHQTQVTAVVSRLQTGSARDLGSYNSSALEQTQLS